MNLKPGNYVATCWQTGKEGGGTGHPHLMIGMITPFTAVSRLMRPHMTTPGSGDTGRGPWPC